MEGGGGALIEPPEEVHLARVHQARLQGLAVVVAGEVQARVAAEEVELLAEEWPRARAWRRAVSTEMIASPNTAAGPARGNASTSVRRRTPR